MQSFMSPLEPLIYAEKSARQRLIDILVGAASCARTDSPEEAMARIARAHDAAETLRHIQNQLEGNG